MLAENTVDKLLLPPLDATQLHVASLLVGCVFNPAAALTMIRVLSQTRT